MRNSLPLYALLIFQTATAQFTPTGPVLPDYPFIRYTENRFEGIHNNPYFINLYAKFDSLIKKGDNQINIVHIGGSHIQADIYTHRIRQDMQSFYPGILGSRGFFFPYKIAHTNSPSNMLISYTGTWETSKNTQPEPLFTLGLSGMTSELTSVKGSLTIVAHYDSLQLYDFNRLRIFCNVSEDDKIPEVYPKDLIRETRIDPLGRYIEYNFSGYVDTLRLSICQYPTQNLFQLYGISMENDDPGVVYNSIGVNGAMLKSYLRCGLFNQQLKALDPDWIIISIGTNEGNTLNFDQVAYRNQYLQLLDSIKLVAPDAAILLTVPNDSYYHKKYINHNTALMRDIILDIAQTNHCGVWDFYTIMGGLNSAGNWYNNGLMSADHIHFNKTGYLLKGDLFFDAFLQGWSDPSFTHPLDILNHCLPLNHSCNLKNKDGETAVSNQSISEKLPNHTCGTESHD
jgi:lysophospholipase L1-like esterase